MDVNFNFCFLNSPIGLENEGKVADNKKGQQVMIRTYRKHKGTAKKNKTCLKNLN